MKLLEIYADAEGEVIEMKPGNIILLNDQDSKGHLGQVQSCVRPVDAVLFNRWL